MTSQFVSYLRLLQFKHYMAEDRADCQCRANRDHYCQKELVHLRNLRRYTKNREFITGEIKRIDDFVNAKLRNLMTKLMNKNQINEALHKKALWQERLDSFYADNKFISDIEQFNFYTEKEDNSPESEEWRM